MCRGVMGYRGLRGKRKRGERKRETEKERGGRERDKNVKGED